MTTPHPDDPGTDGRDSRLLALFCVSLAAFLPLAYFPSMRGPFVLDDASSIMGSPALRHLGSVGALLKGAGGTRARPVATLSLALNYAAGGLSPLGYHATNLAIHAAAALLAFGLVRRTLRSPALAGRLGGSAGPVAFLAALLWALHPLQTEAVSYLSQRTECLMGAFYLATLYALARGAGAGDPVPSARWCALSAACCWLGMASKEVMVTAPVLALLYDRTFFSGSFREALQRRGRTYCAMAAAWAPVAVLLTGAPNRGAGTDLGVAPLAYLHLEGSAILHYLREAAWPGPLVFDYGPYGAVSGMASWAAVAAVLALAAATLALLAKGRPSGFLPAWILVLLAPTSSLVPIAFQPVAEHRMYLPLLAVTVAAALLLRASLRKWAWAAGALAAAALGAATFQANGKYATELALWTDTVAKVPQNPRAHANLGGSLRRLGRKAEARTELEAAVRLDPGEPESLVNLSVALSDLGMPDEAVRTVRRALVVSPDFAEAHYNLGFLLSSRGDAAGAEAEYRRALASYPDFLDAHCNLAELLVHEGRYADAADEYERALDLDPADARLHFNLGYAEVRLGRPNDALIEFREALRIAPTFEAARRNAELLSHPRP